MIENRKLSGTVSNQKGIVACEHTMFSDTSPNVDFNRLFKTSSGKYVTSLEKETEFIISEEWLKEKMISYCTYLNISIKLGDFNDYEKNLIKDLKTKHLSEDYLNGNFNEDITDLTIQSPIVNGIPLAQSLGLKYTNYSYNSYRNDYIGHIYLEKYLITKEFLDLLEKNNLKIM